MGSRVNWPPLIVILTSVVFVVWLRSTFAGGSAAEWVGLVAASPYISAFLTLPVLLYWGSRAAERRSAPMRLFRFGSRSRAARDALKHSLIQVLSLQCMLALLAVETSFGLVWHDPAGWSSTLHRLATTCLTLYAATAVVQVSTLVVTGVWRVLVPALLYALIIGSFKVPDMFGGLNPALGLVEPTGASALERLGITVVGAVLAVGLALLIVASVDRERVVRGRGLFLLSTVAVLLLANTWTSASSSLWESFAALWQGLSPGSPNPIPYLSLVVLSGTPLIAWSLAWEDRCERGASWELMRSGSLRRWLMKQWSAGSIMGISGYLVIVAASLLTTTLIASGWGNLPADMVGGPWSVVGRLLVLGPLNLALATAVIIGVRAGTGSTAASIITGGTCIVLGLVWGAKGFPMAQNSLALAADDPMGLVNRMIVLTACLLVALLTLVTVVPWRLARIGIDGGPSS